MLRIIITLLIALVLAINNVHGKENQSLNAIMTQIGVHMAEAYPLIVAKKPLSDQEIQTLKQKTSKLIPLFEQAKPYIKQKSGTYQVSYDLVLNHLRKTVDSFKQPNSIYSRKQLRTLGTICVSCHTQDTQLRTMFEGSPRSKFGSDFAYAEFSYLTRNYNDAVKYYDKYLRSNDVKTELDIINPIQRLITIHTQVYNSPAIAAKQLSEYLNLPAHTKQTKQHLNGWIKGLKTIRQRHKQEKEQITFKQLETLVGLYIGETDNAGAEFFSSAEDEVSRVWLRGMLFHYLNTNPPESEVPIILYWLSICDRTLGYSFNISFADLYLKDCIVNHSKHEFAKRCYREYEEFVTVSYTGSGGSFIPPELEDELADLRDYIK